VTHELSFEYYTILLYISFRLQMARNLQGPYCIVLLCTA
jgi:hypothetical protein